MGTKLSLYELTSEHHLICEAIEEAGGEITPEIEAMLAINEQNFVTKAEGYAEIIAKYTDFLYNLILGILKLFSPHPISHTTVTVSDTSISSGSISIS